MVLPIRISLSPGLGAEGSFHLASVARRPFCPTEVPEKAYLRGNRRDDRNLRSIQATQMSDKVFSPCTRLFQHLWIHRAAGGYLRSSSPRNSCSGSTPSSSTLRFPPLQASCRRAPRKSRR